MAKVRVVTDSTADIDDGVAEKLGIEMIPQRPLNGELPTK